MKVLFIGGTGNISTAVSKLAVTLGIDLHLLNRGKTKQIIFGAKTITCDKIRQKASDTESGFRENTGTRDDRMKKKIIIKLSTLILSIPFLLMLVGCDGGLAVHGKVYEWINAPPDSKSMIYIANADLPDVEPILKRL